MSWATARAQNLVVNGSFEEYSSCPSDWNQFGGNVVGWDVCAPSPDFFHACRDSSDLGVPFNWRGYQHASHGQGYVGVGTYQWNAPNFREVICSPLSVPLSLGVAVDLSMKVALGGFGSYGLMSPKWTTKGIGMLLTTEPLEWPLISYPNRAHLYMDMVFTDTANWVVLSTTYVPDSVYRYIAIGNFFEDSLSFPTLLDTVFGTLAGAYVYVDEVCVAQEGMGCDFPDLIAMPSVSPWRVVSPFNDRLRISFGSPLERATELVLSDSSGRMVARLLTSTGDTDVDWLLGSLRSGIYVLYSTGFAHNMPPLRVLKLQR